MKRLFKVLVAVFIMACGVSSLYAHGDAGHSHANYEASEAKVQSMANAEIEKLVKANKISKTWLSAPRVDIRKKTFGKKDEWVVKYKNKLINDKKKQKLYVFVTLDGKVIGANYTGK